MPTLIDDLLSTVDELRGLASELGARYYTIGTLLRTWSGGEPGAGTATLTRTTLTPTPKVKDFSLSLNVPEGGYVQAGDILLTGISKLNYTRSDLDGGQITGAQEFFFEVDGETYRVIRVTKGLTDWQVLVRKTAEGPTP